MNDNSQTENRDALLALDQDMNALATMIENARSSIGGGDLIDLTPVGEQIAALCDKAVSLSDPETGAAPNEVITRLMALRDDLEKLERDLIHRQNAEGLGPNG